RRTNSRTSPSKAVAASWLMSLDFSDDFRFGAYISWSGFPGTPTSRSGLMAVMINSYKAQNICAGSPIANQLPHVTWAALGRAGGTLPTDNRRCGVMHDFLETGGHICPTNAA